MSVRSFALCMAKREAAELDECHNGEDFMLSLGNIKCPSWKMHMGDGPYDGTILTAVLGRAWRTVKPVERII